ncbi:hypothetical protein GCM10010193_61650 [Kitasatospora atroaurantiaca]|uniref:DDE superfamily endonuclease n=2 Tax=Kitasatospora atroaurantiaca TaxID=285545 RepID=A0A561F1S8_9ACTN|nr:transposase [Kitasatospora atroaurantiaca]TWE21809.1 DDE superfamily endonuclease [Kitasatospora atroaurantiaca]
MRAAELFEQRVKPSEVARRLRVSRKSACQRHELWRDGGAQALASRGPGGSRCRLSSRCLEKLAAYDWLTVFLLPAYSPGLNPVEWVWAHVKRSLANLAIMALDRLEALVRNRLKRLQYRPDTLDGFIAVTGLTLNTPTSP